MNILFVQKKTGAETDTQSIYPRDDINTAKADMYNYFGAALKDSTVTDVYGIVVADNGALIARCADVHGGIRPRVYTHNDYEDDNLAPYDTERTAQGNYYTKLSKAMKTEGCKEAVVIHITGSGEFEENTYYIKDVEEQPEPTPETEEPQGE